MSELTHNPDSVEVVTKPPICKVPFKFMPPLTAFGKIYLPERLFNDSLSENPSPETLATIAHENTHIKRLGTEIKTYFKFWTNLQFRFQEELTAIRAEMEVLKRNDKDFKVDQRAKMLSGVGYLWCTDFETARKELKNIWEEI